MLYDNKMINKNSSNFSTFYIFNALCYVEQYIIIIRFPFHIHNHIITFSFPLDLLHITGLVE